MPIFSEVDPDQAQETLNIVKKALQDFSWERAGILLCLLVACVVLIRVLVGLADRAMARSRLDRGIRTFLRSGLRVILWLAAVCVLLGYLGVPVTSLIALLSVLGLALSLAIQGTLSNLAGGLMLLSTHPFSTGDFVEVGNISGKVSEVGLVYTKLNTLDNKVIHIPNGEMAAKTIVNYSVEEKRRVDLVFSVSYDAPQETVKSCLAAVAGAHPKILSDPAPFIRVSAYGSSAVEYTVRAWCATEDYWDVYYDLLEQGKAAFDAAGVEMTYEHLNVHVIEP